VAKAQINPEKARWLEVLGVSMPLCLSYIPIGLACGILLHAAGFNFIMTLLVSVLVFSGGAQFILASLLTVNAPLGTIFMSLFFLELRYALLGSSLSKYIKDESARFIFLFSASMNDENYAVNYMKFATDKKWTPDDGLLVEHYSLLAWSVSNMVGGLIGSTININLEVVDFALTALFLYMIVMQVQNHLTLIICFLAGVLGIFFLCLTKSTLGLIIATLLASFVGFAIENTVRRRSENPEANWFLTKLFRPKVTRMTLEDKKAQRQKQEAAKQGKAVAKPQQAVENEDRHSDED
jgi:4-azaleucine resistance transporter AzlC